MDDVAAIKSRIPISQIAGEVTRLRPSGRQMLGLCPLHKERTPSFYVDPQQGLFYCHGCRRGGDVFALYQELHGVDFKTALRELAARAGVDLSGRGEGARARRVDDQAVERAAAEFPGSPAEAWLRGRFGEGAGYVAGRWRLGYAQGRLAIPLRALLGPGFHGFALARLDGAKERKYLLPAEGDHGFQKRAYLYGPPEPPAMGEAVILVEGYTDLWALDLAGVSTPAFALLGTSLGEEAAAWLQRRGVREVYLMLDADAAGWEGAEGIARRHGGLFDLHYVPLPEGCDPHDAWRQGGDEALHSALARSEPLHRRRARAVWEAASRKYPDPYHAALQAVRHFAEELAPRRSLSPGAGGLLRELAAVSGIGTGDLERLALNHLPPSHEPPAPDAESLPPPLPPLEREVLAAALAYPDEAEDLIRSLRPELFHSAQAARIAAVLRSHGSPEAALEALRGSADYAQAAALRLLGAQADASQVGHLLRLWQRRVRLADLVGPH